MSIPRNFFERSFSLGARVVLFSMLSLMLGAPVAIGSYLASAQRTYNSCRQLLRMPPSRQLEVARKTGYSLSQILSACRFNVRKGPSGMLQAERQYQREIRRSQTETHSDRHGSGVANGGSSGSGSSSSESSSPTPNAGTCYSGPVCTGAAQYVTDRKYCPWGSSFAASSGGGCH